MSRTFRRKNYESTCGKKHGSKVAGFYTEWTTYTSTGNGHSGYWDYREPTRLEKTKEYWRIHGESKHRNAWSPSRYYREKYELKMNHWNKIQMIKHLNDPENFDPVFIEKPQSCWWDWL